MAVLSGKNGNLTIDGAQVCPVTNWRIEKFNEIHAYGANDTGGRKKKIAGTWDCSGTFHVNNDVCPVTEGQEYELNLDTGGEDHDLEIMIERCAQECDIDSGAPVGWDITFSGTVISPVCSSSG